jgi:hypothetical protein
MSTGKKEREQYRCTKQKSQVEYPTTMCNEDFHIWLSKIVIQAMEIGIQEVDKDVRALMLPPSNQTKSYRSMFAFGNHIRVCNCEKQLTAMDSGVAATLQQLC